MCTYSHTFLHISPSRSQGDAGLILIITNSLMVISSVMFNTVEIIGKFQHLISYTLYVIFLCYLGFNVNNSNILEECLTSSDQHNC